MNWILKIVASQGLKLGVAYALQIINGVIASMRGVLDYGNVSDDARAKISAVMSALAAVSDFLAKVANLIGAPMTPKAATEDISDAAGKLWRITDSL